MLRLRRRLRFAFVAAVAFFVTIATLTQISPAYAASRPRVVAVAAVVTLHAPTAGPSATPAPTPAPAPVAPAPTAVPPAATTAGVTPSSVSLANLQPYVTLGAHLTLVGGKTAPTPSGTSTKTASNSTGTSLSTNTTTGSGANNPYANYTYSPTTTTTSTNTSTTTNADGTSTSTDSSSTTSTYTSGSGSSGSSGSTGSGSTGSGSTDPGTSGSTDPGTSGSTDPGTSGSTDPGTSGSTDPGTSGSTDPGTSGTTNSPMAPAANAGVADPASGTSSGTTNSVMAPAAAPAPAADPTPAAGTDPAPPASAVTDGPPAPTPATTDAATPAPSSTPPTSSSTPTSGPAPSAPPAGSKVKKTAGVMSPAPDANTPADPSATDPGTVAIAMAPAANAMAPAADTTSATDQAPATPSPTGASADQPAVSNSLNAPNSGPTAGAGAGTTPGQTDAALVPSSAAQSSAPSPAAPTITLSASSSVAAAGGSITITVTATSGGAAVAGQTVAFGTDAGALSSAQCVTGADGTCTVTVSDPVYGLVDITASASGADGSTSAATTTVAFQSVWDIAPGDSAGHAFSLVVSGTNLVLTDNGVTTVRPIATVSGIVITGPAGAPNSLTIDLRGGPITVPVTFSGGTTPGSLTVVSASGLVWTVDQNGGGTVTGADLASLTYSGVGSITASGSGNTLAGPAVDSTWVVNGPDSGTVVGQSFTGFGHLLGAATSQNTFEFQPGGSIDGLVDGGSGNLGTLVLDGNSGNVTSTSTGPHSGLITYQGRPIQYAGMAPILVASATTVTVTGSLANDTLNVGPDPSIAGHIKVASTTGSMESVSFAIPTVSLTIVDTQTGDTVVITGNLLMPGTTFEIDSQNITLNPGVTVDTTNGANPAGPITFNASSLQTGTAPALATVTVNGATVKGGNLVFEAQATSNPTAPSILPSVATVTASSSATVAILGASVITSSGNAVFSSFSTVNAPVNTNGSGSNAALDAAIATGTVSSTATTHVSGTSSLAILGNLSIVAGNTTTVTTTGNATAATAGAGIAIANVTSTTSAIVDGSAGAITAGSILLAADSNNTVTTTATSSPGGSTANNQSPDARTQTVGNPGGFANTASGSVSVAGALAYSNLSSTTLAYIAPSSASGITVTATNPTGATAGTAPIKVHAGSVASSLVSADGSDVGGTSAGVGVAVAVDLANVVTKAYVNNVTLKGAQTAVEALDQVTTGGAPGTFGATTSSGAGGSSSVGVAGALSVNVVSLDTEATLPVSGLASLGAGDDLLFISASNATHTVHAKAGGPAGAVTGIGASVAVDVVNDTTNSGLGNGSTLTGARNLTLQATTGDAMDTEAGGGAASSTAAPAIAVSYSNVTTTANLGTNAHRHRPHRQLPGHGHPERAGGDPGDGGQPGIGLRLRRRHRHHRLQPHDPGHHLPEPLLRQLQLRRHRGVVGRLHGHGQLDRRPRRQRVAAQRGLPGGRPAHLRRLERRPGRRRRRWDADAPGPHP